MYLATEHTTTLPSLEINVLRTLPGNLFFEYEPKEVLETTSPSSNVLSRIFIEFPFSSYPETYREGFIGILEPGEADRMREKLTLFKKRFNDAFAKKHKILFGE
ncbi:hypothetical protein KKB41_04210 [Patescibacteria group bacterium]|nr:hypothetical protein [Patescibacteria group bacterium]